MAAQGRLQLRFELQSCQTVLTVAAQRPPLQVIRSFPIPSGEALTGALVHLHNISGGVLGGDILDCAVEVGAGAYAQLTTTGATRIYRSRTDLAAPALQTMHIHVERGGLCEVVPDPLIPYAGSRYRQQTRVTLDEGAGLFWWEIVTPGREAHGEMFQYESLELENDIYAQDMLIALERAHLQPAEMPLTSAARMGAYRYWATFYVCRVGSDDWFALEETLTPLAQQLSNPPEVVWGCSTLPAHGLIIRALGQSGREIMAGLQTFWQAAKQALYGINAMPPRKIY